MDNQFVYNEAKQYLLDFEEITEEILERHLTLYQVNKPRDLNDLTEGFLRTLTNRRNMGNTIGKIKDITCLYDFNPHKIKSNYDNWEEIYDAIKKIHNPKSMKHKKPKGFWTIFSKGTISGANFLSRFDSLKQFDDFVNIFYERVQTRFALPMLLDKEIFGFGFALACDFLKENGYPKYVKPDVHIKNIFKTLNISNENDDYRICLDVIKFSNSIDKVPYEVDKLFWLIGSGRFYDQDPELKIKSKRSDFCQKVLRARA